MNIQFLRVLSESWMLILVLCISLTQFEQPALPVRVEECVREVIAVILWDFKRFVLDALVQVLKRTEPKIKQTKKQMGKNNK